MKKLGLDASTTTVGYAFVDGKEIVTMGFIPIQKEDTIRDKVRLTMDTITELDPFEKVEQIYIEDSLSGFMRGRTSQQTIIKLAKFNAVLTYCLEFEVLQYLFQLTAYRRKAKACIDLRSIFFLLI